ncbi:MAG: serine/threonine protein kinase [Planctomycetota bacterium]|jgi:serine/threonine-protein kinase
MDADENDLDFVSVALANKLLDRTAIDACREILDKEWASGKTERKIEDIFIERKVLTESEVWAVYKAQSRMSRDAKAASSRRVGGYEIMDKGVEGVLGVVYRARQLSMGRTVALKVLHERWVADEEFRKRFLLEARLVGRLSHQNLIQVFDVGKFKETYFYSMEFIEGETVEDVIQREERLAPLKALDIVFQMMRAIQYLNQYKIVHRDIKPSNIMMTPAGEAKLGDFGFVMSNLENVLSSEGEVLGTPDYISPEAAIGAQDLDIRSDIYSLGATFYHMLAGAPAFKGSPSEVMDKHVSDPPPPLKGIRPELSDHLCLVVDKMMAKERENRYQGAAELFDDLELLRSAERTASGDPQPTKSTIIRALERGRLRVGELLESKREFEDSLERCRFHVKLACVALVLSVVLNVVLAVKLLSVS